MYEKQKFTFDYEVDKPLCDSCGKEFEEVEVKETANVSYAVQERLAPEHKWNVEETVHIEGEKLEYHTKCLRVALKISSKPKRA